MLRYDLAKMLLIVGLPLQVSSEKECILRWFNIELQVMGLAAYGGRSLEDVRMLKHDRALSALLKTQSLPSTDALGAWLRRTTGAGVGYAGLSRINQQGVVQRLRQCGVILHDEFREGNVAPATSNLAFIQACEAQLPKGHTIAHVQLDSAGYQADIFNHCEETNKTFAIDGRIDKPTLQAIESLPDTAWNHYADADIAESLHCMADTKKSFRLIVIKYNWQADLFNDPPKYHVIASNRQESAESTVVWYRQRGEVSENGIKELKIGFGMERMPCG